VKPTCRDRSTERGGWLATCGASAAARSLRRIGVIYGIAETDSEGRAWDASFRKRLAELGSIDGRNVHVEDRWTDGSLDRTKLFANELVRLKPDVLVAVTTPVTAALQHETRTIPIIFTSVSDPVGSSWRAYQIPEATLPASLIWRPL
jgi:putative ABC transport system substrate-binding protein